MKRERPSDTVYIGGGLNDPGMAHPIFATPLGQDEAHECAMRGTVHGIETWLDYTGELAPYTCLWEVRRVRIERREIGGIRVHGGIRDAPPAESVATDPQGDLFGAGPAPALDIPAAPMYRSSTEQDHP